MSSPFRMGPGEGYDMFPPFEESLKLLKNIGISTNRPLTNDAGSDMIKIGKLHFDASEEGWITIGSNKQSVPVREGESKLEAAERFIEKKEAEKESEKASEKVEALTPIGQTETGLGKGVGESSTETEQETRKLSVTGSNQNIPDMPQEVLNRHFGSGKRSDHSKKYPDLTKEQYFEWANSLARSETSDNVLGCKAGNGEVVGYDKTENDFVKASIKRGPITMFKPDDK